jgi:hypothetical protein
MGEIWAEVILALTQERDELVERLEVIEGEAVVKLREILLDGQRQSEGIEAELDILAVEEAEFMRQVDSQNAAAEVATLELEELLRITLLQDEEQDSETAIPPEAREVPVVVPDKEPNAARRLEEIGAQLGILLVQGQILMEER